ncbi:MAG TPA: DUF4105 domain-containing protein, partial [Nitrospirota bacterium]|nr:DUF4105 domain-containing protein [Nitrospirota bacterium]
FIAAPLFLVLLSGGRLLAADDSPYLSGLLASAREKGLSEDRYWDVLLHYRRSGRSAESLVDDPQFFLALDGKNNPRAELEATLRSFFQEEQTGSEHPRCRFVARYQWLKERLQIDEGRLPPVTCARFEDAFARINPKSAVLVFPSAHPSSPTTMFGHTFIRIDGAYESELISHGVSYGAVITDTNGIVYGFKGVFGFYRGYFSILPYYAKVKEYTYMEHRDMWEYGLDLTEDEVRRMVLHIWELENNYSDYYFFDENCSSMLLFLIEAARPSLHLTDQAGSGIRFWVIPSDTIRIMRENGLIKQVKYRPSQARRIHAMASSLDQPGQITALAVVDKTISPQFVLESEKTPEEKMKILDLSAEFLQYRALRGEIAKEDYLKEYLNILNARSTLGKPAGELYPLPQPPQPEEGHRSGRMSVGAGYRGDRAFAEFNWRAAYHDLLDPDEGYVEGSEIKFGDVTGRYFFADNSMKLQSLHLIDIVSLAPRDLFFKPLSWKVNTGFDRELLRDGDDHLVYRLNPGRGFAFHGLGGIVYLMGEADALLSSAFKNRFSVGIGASAGVLAKESGIGKLHLFLQARYYGIVEEHSSIKAAASQNFKITTNNSVTASLSRERAFSLYRSEARLAWNYYY